MLAVDSIVTENTLGLINFVNNMFLILVILKLVRSYQLLH